MTDFALSGMPIVLKERGYPVLRISGLGDDDPDAARMDVSVMEDMSGALADLIALEQHLAASASNTSNGKYLDALEAVRKLRRELQAQCQPNAAGQEWCMGKHYLSAAMRCLEVGTKLLTAGQRDKAGSMFKRAEWLRKQFVALTVGQGVLSPDAPRMCDICYGG